MEGVAEEAGKPWEPTKKDRKNIQIAVNKHGGETVVNTWRDWLDAGESAKLSFFLDDADYSKHRKLKAQEPARCEIHGTRLIPGEEKDDCPDCLRENRDGFFPPDLTAEMHKKRQAVS